MENMNSAEFVNSTPQSQTQTDTLRLDEIHHPVQQVDTTNENETEIDHPMQITTIDTVNSLENSPSQSFPPQHILEGNHRVTCFNIQSIMDQDSNKTMIDDDHQQPQSENENKHYNPELKEQSSIISANINTNSVSIKSCFPNISPPNNPTSFGTEKLTEHQPDVSSCFSSFIQQQSAEFEETSLQNKIEPSVITPSSEILKTTNLSNQSGGTQQNMNLSSQELSIDSSMNKIPEESSAFIGPIKPQSDKSMEVDSKFQTSQKLPDQSYDLSPSCTFQCLYTASDVFMKQGKENFLRGCKWSPDGMQVMTNSNDNVLRVFDLTDPIDTPDNQMSPSTVVRESGLVYDYSWFPGMTRADPSTCRVACSCPGSPIHLWDSNLGSLVSSYRAFDHCDELTHAYSLSFSPDGSHIYGGYKNCIRIFDTEYSHKRHSTIKTYDSKTKEGYRGIISCFSHSPRDSRMFVTGSYSRHIGIYHSLTNELLCLIQGQQGGVTHAMFSPDGTKLYTGGRKDPEIVCWDMRNTGVILSTFLRDVQTNQRIYFDLSPSGRYLVSGNQDGSVQVWDTHLPGTQVGEEIIMKPALTFRAHLDCTNGVSFSPTSPMLATASGQRHFGNFGCDPDSDSNSSDSGMDQDPNDVVDFSLKVWKIPCIS